MLDRESYGHPKCHSMSEVIPADSTITAIIIALKYSTRPKPKGCSRSAGRSESFVPTIVITLERASLRLFTASIMIATLLAKIPTTALNAANNTFATAYYTGTDNLLGTVHI